jgi:hypothetical protein
MSDKPKDKPEDLPGPALTPATAEPVVLAEPAVATEPTLSAATPASEEGTAASSGPGSGSDDKKPKTAKKPLRKPAPRKPLRARLREHGPNALFLLGAIVCFGLFGYNYFQGGPAGDASSEGAIATVAAGQADQKRNGSASFVSASEGSRLYNRDALWVGPGGEATIVFDDGTALSMQENTFLVLKRGLVRLGEDPGVQLLKGKVEIKAPTRLLGSSRFKIEMKDRTIVTGDGAAKSGSEVVQTDSRGNALDGGDPNAVQPSPSPPIPAGTTPRDEPPTSPLPENAPLPTSTPKRPSPKPSPEAKNLDAKVNPKPGSLILLIKEKVAQVTFSWPKGLDGTLSITDDQGTPVASLPVAAVKRFVKHALPMGKTYRWRLIAADGKKP